MFLLRAEPDLKLAGIDKDSGDKDVIAARVKYPNIIQRPIVEVGAR